MKTKAPIINNKANRKPWELLLFSSLSSISNQDFNEDIWEYDSGKGGGITRIFANGDIEKAGVNFSSLSGKLSDKISKKVIGSGKDFYATGVSVVIHPKNPMAPTVHANYRYFEMYDDKGIILDQWFGGGQDLTPYYLFEEDVVHFHQQCKRACDKYHPETIYQ